MQKTALSCDSFTTGYFVLFVLFIVPHIATSSGRIILWFLPLACLIPLAIMPVIYMTVHHFDTLLFGRYHLIMPLSAFLSALFFVLLWSVDGYGLSAFFGVFVFGVSISVYRYCAYSVRARLSGDNIISVSPYSQAFSMFGAACALVTLFGFMYYDRETAFINTAYVIGGVSVLLSMLQYLVTYYGIPQLGGRRVQSLKTVYRLFYTGLDRRAYVSSLLFCAAFMLLTVLIIFFALLNGMYVYYAVVCGGIEAVSYCVFASLFAKKIAHRSKWLSIASLSGFIVASAMLIVAGAVEFSVNAFISFVAVSAFIIGIAGALTVRQTELRFLSVKQRMTSGAVFILLELTAVSAVAIAVFSAAVVVETVFVTGSSIACVCGIAVSILLAIAAFISARKRSTKNPSPPLSYELCTSETEGAGDGITDGSQPVATEK